MANTIQQQCVTRIHKNFKDMGASLSHDDIKDVINELTELAKSKYQNAGKYGRQLQLAARELTEREKIALAVERGLRARSVIARKEYIGRVDAITGTTRATVSGIVKGVFGGKKGVSRNFADAMEVIDLGSIQKGDDFGLSMSAKGNTYEATAIGRLAADFYRNPEVLAKLRGTWLLGKRDVAFERQVAMEMSRGNGGGDPETGSRTAAKAAQVINKHIEALRLELNNAGAYISKREGYIIAQTHDKYRMLKAGKDQWVADIEGKLAAETFTGVTDTQSARREFLGKVFDRLTTSVHEDEVPFDGGIPGFKGPGNVAKRLSASRKLHFKDGGTWFDYHQNYGHGSLFEGVVSQLQRGAHNRALLETYGPNPVAMRDDIINRLMVRARDAGDVETAERLSASRNFNDIQAARFRAAANLHHVGNPTMARVASNTRAALNMASLGRAVLTNFSDLAANMAVLRHNGYSVLGSIGRSLHSLTPGALAGAKRDHALTLGAFTDGILGDIHTRWSAADTPSGQMSRLQTAFFKINGMQFWQDRLSAGMSLALSERLGRAQGAAFADLPGRLQTNLRRYGIHEDEWTALNAIQRRDGYLLTDTIPNETLSNKLSTFYVDQTREGMTMPSAREAAWTEMFGNRGTWSGESARFALQFKSFTMSYTNKHLGREFLRDGVDFSNMAFLGAFTTMLGYLSLTAKDLLAGKSPRDPNTAQTMSDSMLQGGFGGMFGDLLMSEYDSYGGPIVAASGPLVGRIGGFLLDINTLRNWALGQKDLPQSFERRQAFAAINSMPFANLIGFRDALNWMVLYQAQEWMDPGSLRRSEQNMQKRTGQHMLVSPANAIPYGGGDRLGEGVR